MKFVIVSVLFSCMPSFPDEKGAFLDNLDHDYDNDGLTENEGDCDDNNDDIQKLIWYADADGDGFGIESLQTESCTRPEGYTENIGDCNDENAEINPEAQEICDGIDNNCNTTVDDDENGWLQSSGTYFEDWMTFGAG